MKAGEMMRAVTITAPGVPDNMVVVERPVPSPGPGEVLIEVAFAGCNFADTMLRVGSYPHPTPYPMVPGFEVSGRVAVVGAGVTRVTVGERVAGYAEHGGGYAQACLCPEANLIPLPDEVGLDVGAAFSLQGLTAWHMLHTIGRVQPGQTVLVHAVGGGVGLYLTEIAVHAGACVIGTVGTAGKERRALDYGAVLVINHTQEDFVEAVLSMTGGAGVDLVLDSLGAATLDRSFGCVRRLGHVISYGEAEGTPFPNIRERLLPRSLTFTRFHLGHVDPVLPIWRAGVEATLGGIMESWLKVPIEAVFPLAEAAAMHERLGSRQVAGKLLLDVNA